MTSARKIEANRTNAQKSSGPRTVHGRARAARNALRHGLSVAVSSNPSAVAAAEALAREIAGPKADRAILPLARRIAEAQLDLNRVRRARDELIARILADPYYRTRAGFRKTVGMLLACLEGKPDQPEDLDELVTSKLDQPERIGVMVLREARELILFDRYERRALSRRKFAIREFDAVRRHTRSRSE